MKNKLLLINLFLIILNFMITIYLFSFPIDEYALYAEYILFTSYVGIYTLGLSSTYQLKLHDKIKSYNNDLVVELIPRSLLVNGFVFFISNIYLEYQILYLFVILIYNLNFVSKTLLNLQHDFLLVKKIEIIERLFLLITVFYLKDIVYLIYCDLLIKFVLTIFILLKIYKSVDGEKIILKGIDYRNGFVMMLGNWLLIVILNFDKNLLLAADQINFAYYSIAVSLLVLLNSFLLPLRMVYFTLKDENASEFLSDASFILAFLSIIGVLILSKLGVFLDKSISFEIFINMLYVLPLFLQVNINLINKMQLLKVNYYVLINIFIVSVLYMVNKYLYISITNIIEFKFITLLIVVFAYSVVLKDKNVVYTVLVSFIIFILSKFLFIGVILFLIIKIGRRRYALLSI